MRAAAAVAPSLLGALLLSACEAPPARQEVASRPPAVALSAPVEAAPPQPADESPAASFRAPPPAGTGDFTERFRAGAAQQGAAARPAAAGGQPAPALPRERRELLHVRVGSSRGLYRPEQTLTFGVPFARGDLSEPEELRGWRAGDDVPLPLQARALSRWPDGSVRWALLDTQVELQPRGETLLAVGTAADIPPSPDPWQVERDEHGNMVLHDGYTRWTLWRPGELGDEVLGMRALLVDRFEHEYGAFVDPASVELLEWGPLRVVARLRGAHRKIGDGGLGIDFHTFTAHVHLLAGRSTARVEWTLENGPLADPPGRLAFLEYALLLAPPDGELTAQPSSVAAAGPVAFQLRHDQRGPQHLVGGQRVDAGDPQLDLWAGLAGERGDVWVHRVESAPNHPNGISWSPGEPLRVSLLARTPERAFFLDDGQRKTFRLHVVRDVGAGGREHCQRLALEPHVALNPLEVLATEAWGDAGIFYLPPAGELDPAAARWHDPPTGWADWGETAGKSTRQTGSPRNRLSVFLEALQSGDVTLFRQARSRAWHALDLRPYHLLGFRAENHPQANLYEGLPHENQSAPFRLGRTGIDERFPEYKAGLPPGGHGYNGFDPEHMTLDDVYECFLLTGDWLALSALRSAGEAMLTWKELLPDGGIHSSRTFGWTLRALVQVHRATGDARFLEAAERYVARADAERGTGDVKWLRRSSPDARHLDEPYETPFMVAVALHGLAAYHAETGDERVPPMMADLVSFCMAAYRDGGFLGDLPTDRVLEGGVVSEPLGTSTWIPGAIAAAAFVTGDHEPVDRILPYYALLKTHSSDPVRFGSKDWHWWQPYLASLQRRHGALAVGGPQLFLTTQRQQDAPPR